VPNNIIREVGLMKKLSNPKAPNRNIVQLIKTTLVPSKFLIGVELELCDSNLKGFIHKGGMYDGKTVRHLMRDLLVGLKSFQDNEVIHRDLKPENLLLKGSNPVVLKIADFGLARWTRDHVGADESNQLVLPLSLSLSLFSTLGFLLLLLYN
jgi:serine/threonine protein kinase